MRADNSDSTLAADEERVRALVNWVETNIGGEVVAVDRHGRWRPAWFVDVKIGTEKKQLYVRGARQVSNGLAVLEQEGLVQRQSDPTDGRQVLFALTDKGIATRRHNSHLKREWLSAAMAKLDPTEQQSLIAAAALIKRLSDS